MGKHRCVCNTEFCREDGGEATIRKDEALFKSWCTAMLGQESLDRPLRDARISAAHFPPGSLTADENVGAVGGATAEVKVKEGALPSLSNADMVRASKGALARSFRAEALVERHKKALLVGAAREQELESDIMDLRLQIVGLEAEISEREEGAGQSKRRNGIDHDIMVGKTDTACRSLVGLSHESLSVSPIPSLC